METEFRLYKNKDYNDLIEMIRSLYREDPEGESIDEEKMKRTIEKYRSDPEQVMIYLLQRKKVNIGYAILVYYWSNEYGGNIITIDELYVREEYRNQGVATEFFYFLERMENKVALQLETTPSNRRAFQYYQRLGFVPGGNIHLIKKTAW